MEEVQQNSISRTKGNIQVLGFGGSSLQALIRKDGPDPVSRAVQMTKISFPAALNLVSEFMDGSALNLARLMKDISKARFWKLTAPAVWIGTLTPEVDLD